MSVVEYNLNDINPMRWLLDGLINGSSLNPNAKGGHDEYIQQIFEDAIKLLTASEEDYRDVMYSIDRKTFRNAIDLSQNISLKWFDGIDTEHLTIGDYKKYLNFIETFEYNKTYSYKYIDTNSVIWKPIGEIFHNHEKLIGIEVDWSYTDSSVYLEDLPNQESRLALSEEDFQKNYKCMKKDYE